jgi:hypothetical protein
MVLKSVGNKNYFNIKLHLELTTIACRNLYFKRPRLGAEGGEGVAGFSFSSYFILDKPIAFFNAPNLYDNSHRAFLPISFIFALP